MLEFYKPLEHANSPLSRFKNPIDCRAGPPPGVSAFLQPLSARGAQSVILGPSIVRRDVPSRFQIAAEFKAMQRGVQSTFFNRQGLLGHRVNPFADFISVLLSARER